eukprot:3675930-Rhodomonas_salina.4
MTSSSSTIGMMKSVPRCVTARTLATEITQLQSCTRHPERRFWHCAVSGHQNVSHCAPRNNPSLLQAKWPVFDLRCACGRKWRSSSMTAPRPTSPSLLSATTPSLACSDSLCGKCASGCSRSGGLTGVRSRSVNDAMCLFSDVMCLFSDAMCLFSDAMCLFSLCVSSATRCVSSRRCNAYLQRCHVHLQRRAVHLQ